MIEKINADQLREMFAAGAALLQENKAGVDAMNVFPVPDGDTGTNMSMTLNSAVAEMANAKSNTVKDVSAAMARGALRGARGNSGVISSQIFRGISKGLANVDEIDTEAFANALRSGVDMAYKAVMKPREGTILTVARAAADAAVRAARRERDISRFLDIVIDAANAALDKTPEQLPVLKEAGVVDAGGKGLIIIYSGFKQALDGGEFHFDFQTITTEEERSAASMELSTSDIKYAYCTEFFVVNLKEGVDERARDSFTDHLQKIGDSVVVVGDDDMIKVHVHTNDPGKALQWGLRLGELSKLKIDNMREQHRKLASDGTLSDEGAPEKLVQYGMVSVVAGDGLADIFRDIGVDVVVEGGQSMNPAIADIADAVQQVKAENVFVYPNNSNVILAAQQAQELVENRNVIIIPTKTAPQGIAAVLAFMEDADPEANREEMMEAISTVSTGEVTFAVRDTRYNGLSIHKGDIIGLDDDGICAVGKTVDEVAVDLLSSIVDDEKGMITLFWGHDVTEEDAKALTEEISVRFPDLEVECQRGGQPLYYYIFSVE
ncbi:MAG: DAK2 domain-containing protein [Clostridia bacterium]|nr:DAK2 domain-containing protein [Clostridia bacterium]